MLWASSNKPVLRLLVLLVIASGAAQTASAASVSLPAKETLDYTIEWRLITAGRARLEWSADRSTDNPGWQAKLHMESTGLVSKLFKVDDSYTATLRSDLCAIGSFMTTHEGRRHRETRVTYDERARKASYLEKDTMKGVVVLSKEINIPACVHDVVGGLYFLRTLRLEPGQATFIPVSDGKKSVAARVESQQREEVKTPAGTFRTIRYEVFLFNNVLYKRSAHLYVWLTDDQRKLPVQIQVRLRFAIGTITLLLEKVEQT